MANTVTDRLGFAVRGRRQEQAELVLRVPVQLVIRADLAADDAGDAGHELGRLTPARRLTKQVRVHDLDHHHREQRPSRDRGDVEVAVEPTP
jgi:hypothetical protein